MPLRKDSSRKPASSNESVEYLPTQDQRKNRVAKGLGVAGEMLGGGVLAVSGVAIACTNLASSVPAEIGGGRLSPDQVASAMDLSPSALDVVYPIFDTVMQSSTPGEALLKAVGGLAVALGGIVAGHHAWGRS